MKRLSRLPLYSLLIGISLAIGFAVPVIYEWTQKPPARSRIPSMERAAIGVLLLTALAVVASAILVKLMQPAEEPPTSQRPKLQFGLRGLFAVTTALALFFAAVRWLDAPWSSGLVAAAAAGAMGWSLSRGAAAAWRLGALLACMFFPFVWMIAYNVPFGQASGLALILPVGPAVLPAEIIRSVLDSSLSPDDMMPVAAVIVIGELALGAWLSARGGRSLLAFLILALIVSTISSLGVHVLYRM